MQGWEQILDRFGWPTLIVVGFIALGRMVIWPIIKRKLEQGDKAVEQVNDLLARQVEKAEARIAKADDMQAGLLREFKDAIEQSTRESRRQGDLLEELLRRTPRQ